MNLNKILYWMPRGLSLFLIFFWASVFFVQDLGNYVAAAMMVWFLVFLVTLLAWKNAPLGGGFYIVLGILYLVFILRSFSFSSFLAAAPFLVVGLLFIGDYSYQKKKENKKRKD